MKIKFYQFLLAFCVAISLCFAFSASAEAYTQCKVVHGYWHNGYYHRSHRVCWQTHRVRHCGWRNGQKVCWYN